MSSVKVQAPVATKPGPIAKPSVDEEHLRRIVEKQPACLMRVGIDGLILAANDAALGLFGAQQPAAVLGGLLTKWIVPSHQGAWSEFSRTVAAGISQSVECDLIDVSGTQRSVVFHGVPLVDHADGVPSLILGARDASALRRLEIALQESEAIRRKLAAGPTPLAIENVSVDLRDLQAKLDEAEADRDRLERALSRLPQLEQLLKQGKTHLQELRARLDEATNERNRLAAQLNEREASNEQLWSEQAELQQALAEKQQRELDELHTRLHDANATRDAVAARLHARENEHELLVAEHHELRSKYDDLRTNYDELRTEHAQAERSIETNKQELGVLRANLDETISEKDHLVIQLADRIGEHERALSDHERALTEHARARSDQDDRHRLEMDEHYLVLDGLRVEMEQATTERDRLRGQLSDLESTHERHVREHSELNQLLGDHRRQLGDLRTQFEETATDRDRIAEQLRDAETYCQQLSNDHNAERTRHDEERARYEDERARYDEERARHEEERARHDEERARHEEERARSEEDRVRHEEERTHLEDAVAAAIAQQKASEKTLADHRIELQSMDLAARRTEPLAAAGRLALDIARELVTAVADIDARAACLVAECSLESSSREEVEQLRADAVRAASLARQILQANHLNHSEERK